MRWRDSQAFFYLWLLLLLFYAVRAILLRAGLLGYPALEPTEFLNFLLTVLMVPPIVATLACLSRPVNGEPLAALLLGAPTYLLSFGRSFPPLGCLLTRCPWGTAARAWAGVLLALSIIWGLSCSLLAGSKEPRDWKAAVGAFLLLVAWTFPLGFMLD